MRRRSQCWPLGQSAVQVYEVLRCSAKLLCAYVVSIACCPWYAASQISPIKMLPHSDMATRNPHTPTPSILILTLIPLRINTHYLPEELRLRCTVQHRSHEAEL